MIYEFQATQDLHGYDKPWAPGDGINLWDDSIAPTTITVYTTVGTITSAPGRILHLPSGTYTFSFNGSTSSYIYGNVLNADDSWDSTFKLTAPQSQTPTVTIADGQYLNLYIASGSLSVLTSGQIMLNSGSTAQPYSPYSNICPPEGFNIWDPYNNEFIQVYAGYVNSNTRELYLRPVYEEYAGEELVGPWMSSLDEYSEDATPTEGAFVIDFGGELTSYEITPFMLQTLLDSLGIRQHFTDGAGLLNKLMDQAQGRVRSEEELLHLSRPLKVIAIGDQLPAGLTFKPISKDVLPGLPGKFIR